MKIGYLELDLLLLIVYISFTHQLTMAKHAHPHRSPNRASAECRHCPPGHYCLLSKHRTACYPCSRCGPGLYVAHPCTRHGDTVCDSCHTYRGPHNDDFFERCVRPAIMSANGTEDTSSQHEESESVKAVTLSRGVPASVVIASSAVIGALALGILLTCAVAINRRYCKSVDHRYHYAAVATKEAVML